MNPYLFFDSASTTKCCEGAVELFRKYASEDYGNPASTHLLGQKAAKAIREARLFFSDLFHVSPEQVIFTGSGSEANNLAIAGIALGELVRKRDAQAPIQVLTSATEHPSVKRSVESLKDFGIHAQFLPVNSSGQPSIDSLTDVLSTTASKTHLLSVQQVNNITGALIDVETLARKAKSLCPGLIFHTDSIQAFGKVPVPKSSSSVDLVTVSSHKIEGPKGIGALILLNRNLKASKLRPLIWGGDQEFGLRAGTQNAGLIAGFHFAAIQALQNQKTHYQHAVQLREKLRFELQEKNLLTSSLGRSVVRWNSPDSSTPFIVNLSLPGIPASPLIKLLEERGCLVSVGSACTAKKPGPDPVLQAMGLPLEIQTSSIRISFSRFNQIEDIQVLVQALYESIEQMGRLLGKSFLKNSTLPIAKKLTEEHELIHG